MSLGDPGLAFETWETTKLHGYFPRGPVQLLAPGCCHLEQPDALQHVTEKKEPAAGTTAGCPILGASLSLRQGWEHEPQPREQPDAPRRVTPEMNELAPHPPRRSNTKIAQNGSPRNAAIS